MTNDRNLIQCATTAGKPVMGASGVPTRLGTTVLGRVKATVFRRDLWRVQGRDVTLGVVERPPAVGVVPIRGNGCGVELLLIRQSRPAVGGWVTEIVAGKVDSGEDARSAARRELAEEAGLQASVFIQITPVPLLVSPGYSSELMTLFVAKKLTEVGRRPEDEHIECEWVTLSDALARVRCGELTDTKSIIAVLLIAQLDETNK
ncbi:MAG: NUDIX hydrolase [Candidatus Dormibacteria bacterium]